jgi:catechol 2,3-dioxygenase-like lactoylglutathione lyase family enzyme
MYDHIGLRVGDLDASVRFYTAALAPLGFVLCSRDDSGAGFGPKGAPALWLHLHKGSAGQRPCRVPRHGSRGDQAIPCRGPEGRRPRQWRRRARADYSPTYYAAFLIDPDGNNVEAVCT